MKKNRILTILLVIFIITTVAEGGFILYKEVLSNDNEIEINENENNDDNIKDDDNIKNESIDDICNETIFYNPIEDKTCNIGDSQCMTWYKIPSDSNDDSNIELILNKNIGETVAYNESGNFKEGPSTINGYLKKLTSTWKVSVRLPEIDDIAIILGTEKSENGNIGYMEVPWCIYANGDNKDYWDGGYWLITDSKNSNPFVIDSSRGTISAGNQFIKSNPDVDYIWGIRPIIRVEKSKVY